MRERTRFPREVLQELTDLRLLVSTGPANAAIDVSAARQLGITVEHTWALMLAAARNLLVEANSMRSGGWQVSDGTGLHGTTLGVLGLGRVGSLVARIGQAFGMRTIAWSQNLTAQDACDHGVQAVPKEQLFAQSDVLSIHVALSERTRGLVGAAELQAMKPIAILVNTSRGPILYEQALIDTLRDKRPQFRENSREPPLLENGTRRRRRQSGELCGPAMYVARFDNDDVIPAT